MQHSLEPLHNLGIVPVVTIHDAAQAVPLAEALIRGGLPCAEITFRTAAAPQAIAAIAKACPDMLVGAGTVLTPKQADDAIQAGAGFLVSPGLNPEVVRHCVEKGYPILPGTATPSEVEQARGFGLRTVKFFPAEAAGGLPMIKAMSAPYTDMKFMPTGGISPANVAKYLACPAVFACGGSWMVPVDLIRAGRFDAIEQLTREAVHTMLGLEVCGLQLPAAQGSVLGERLTAALAGGTEGTPFLQTVSENGEGCLLVSAHSVERAVRYFGAAGVAVREDTLCRNEKGMAVSVCLSQTVGSLTVKLVQK